MTSPGRYLPALPVHGFVVGDSGAECIEPECPRPSYDEGGRCKAHADLHAYRMAGIR